MGGACKKKNETGHLLTPTAGCPAEETLRQYGIGGQLRRPGKGSGSIRRGANGETRGRGKTGPFSCWQETIGDSRQARPEGEGRGAILNHKAEAPGQRAPYATLAGVKDERREGARWSNSRKGRVGACALDTATGPSGVQEEWGGLAVGKERRKGAGTVRTTTRGDSARAKGKSASAKKQATTFCQETRCLGYEEVRLGPNTKKKTVLSNDEH